VAVAPDGTLYVMDRGNYRVVHLSASGEFLGAFGQLGTTPEKIYKGWDIKVDAAGNIYTHGSLKSGQVSRIEVSSRYDRDAYRDQ
jgi:hypothetical protein